MKKILILGSGGSGKSTLAKWMGDLLNIEVVHPDYYYWKPNWVETSKDEWNKKISILLAKNNWIMDGNWTGSLQYRIEFSDTIIFLDYPRFISIWRIIKRYCKYHGKTRPDMGVGCIEKIDYEFLKWIWDYNSNIKPKINQLIRQAQNNKRIIVIKNNQELLQLKTNLQKNISNLKKDERDFSCPSL